MKHFGDVMFEVLRVSLDVSAVPEKPAGAGRYIVELARRLNDRPEVHLTVLVRKGDSERWVAWLGHDQVKAVIPDARPLRLIFERFFLGRVVDALGVDLHHGPHYTMAKLKSTPVVVTIPDTTFFDFPEFHEGTKVFFFRRAIRRAARKATRLIALSEMTARQLADRVEVTVPVDVVHLGVDLKRFADSSPSDPSLLHAQGLTPGVPTIVFVSTLEPRKGIVELLKAFDQLAALDRSLTLVLVGQRGWGEGVEQHLATVTHRDRVLLLGYVDDATLGAVVRNATVLAYPSVAEGFGLPAIEALAASTTLVTTKGSVMEELVDGTALLTEPSNAVDLARTLAEALAEEEPDRLRRHERGRQVAARFTWDACVDGHLAVYGLAVSAGKSGSVR